MKYRVTLEGAEREVDVTIAPGGEISVTLDGHAIDAEVRAIPGGVRVRRGTTLHEVLVSGTDEVQLASGASRGVAQVLSEKARAQRARAGGGAVAKELRAPMPGRVVRVLCAAGDAVTAGQALMVVEAMKMENDLRAPAAGVVSQVHVSEGASVEGRALLVTFG